MDSVMFQQNAKTSNWIKRIMLFVFFLFCALGLSSCAGAGKDYNTTEGKYSATYNSSNNTTVVVFNTTIENKSVLDIKNISYSFDLYNGDNLIKTTDLLSFNITIDHGKTVSFERSFSFDGDINKVRLVKEDVTFKNLWDTYLPWFIVTISVVGLFTIIYAIVAFTNYLELGDIFELIGDNWWFIFILVVPYIPYLITSFSSGVWSWIPPLIIMGGILAIVIALLLIHLIKFIIESISVSGGYDSAPAYPKDPSFNNQNEKIEDYLNDEERLYKFTISQLKEYCKDNGIKGYSSLTKDGVVELIMNSHQIGTEAPVKETKPAKKIATGNIRFDDIAGLETAKEAFREKVVLPFEHPEIYEKFGKKAGGGILLYGLPGTGKTMFAEAASNEVNALFIPVKCSDIKSKWYGESEQKVKDIFKKARKAERAIIFFDEFEAIGAKRTDSSDNGNNDLVPQILAEMQGVGSSLSKSTIVVIAATNKPWSIDSAFMRPGRFDEKIYIPLPDKVARKKLFEIQLSKLPVADDLDYDYLVEITEGFNGADIKEVCEKLKMSAIKDSLEKGEEQTIGMDDVKRIENSIKSSVSNEDIVRLELFESSLNWFVMKNESHRHHYIPQFILRNFSIRGDGFVKFYDLKKKTITNKPTEEIFLYNDLYRDDSDQRNPTKIENDLAKYENEIAMLFIKKVYKGDTIELTIEEEDMLKLFLTIMGLRNKKAKIVFGEDTDSRILEMFKPYLVNSTLEDLWKKNLGLLVNCRSIQEVIDSEKIIDPFKSFVLLNSFGLAGTFFIFVERRGNEDFVVGDSYPSYQMARTEDGTNLPMLSYYPISPKRAIILAISDIKSIKQSAKQINGTLFRKPVSIENGKVLRYSVKKIYEQDVSFINNFAWKFAKDGVAFIDDKRVTIPEQI